MPGIPAYTIQEIIIRILLLAGMLLHKLVWEIKKREQPRESVNGGSTRSLQPSLAPLKRLLKLVKILTLVFLVVQTIILDIFPITDGSTTLRWVGFGIFIFGLGLAISGRLALGKNWENIEDYRVLPDQKLVDTGVYRLIRHPIYCGDFLLVLGLELALNSWLVLLALPLGLYIYYQARAEETLLVAKIPGYASYQKRTKMFIPYVI